MATLQGLLLGEPGLTCCCQPGISLECVGGESYPVPSYRVAAVSSLQFDSLLWGWKEALALLFLPQFLPWVPWVCLGSCGERALGKGFAGQISIGKMDKAISSLFFFFLKRETFAAFSVSCPHQESCVFI